MSLKEWQQGVSNSILNNTDVEDITHSERFSIYRHGYYIRLYESLKKDYPVLYKLMGGEAFSKLIIAYLAEHSPRHYSIIQVGAHLPRFIGDGDFPRYLYELAMLEWALIEAYYAKDAEVLTIDHLAKYGQDDWPSIIFKLNDSTHFIENKFDIASLYDNVENEKMPLINTIIIWRQGNKSCFQTLKQQELNLFKLVKSEKSFNEICDSVNGDEKSIQNLTEILIYWINQGVFIA